MWSIIRNACSNARNGWLADYNDPISFLDMWITGSGNNDVQYGKGAHAELAMYDLDLTAYGYDLKVEAGTWAETYDELIAIIKSCTDNATRYALMHVAEDMLMATGCITPCTSTPISTCWMTPWKASSAPPGLQVLHVHHHRRLI